MPPRTRRGTKKRTIISKKNVPKKREKKCCDHVCVLKEEFPSQNELWKYWQNAFAIRQVYREQIPRPFSGGKKDKKGFIPRTLPYQCAICFGEITAEETKNDHGKFIRCSNNGKFQPFQLVTSYLSDLHEVVYWTFRPTILHDDCFSSLDDLNLPSYFKYADEK